MGSAENRAFIRTIAPLIQKYAKEFGYKVASPIIAQACLESRYGNSGLAKYHNYFGLKCGSSWKGASVNMKTKEEYTVGTLTTIRDNFRAYDSMEAGVVGYFEFISTKRYANLKTATSALQYLTLIKYDGYATSSTYVNSNMNVVNTYDLTSYDTILLEETTSAITYPTLKMGSMNAYVTILQKAIGMTGEDIDGIFGNKTYNAIKEYQRTHKDNEGKPLTVDGIVGVKTWSSLIKK